MVVYEHGCSGCPVDVVMCGVEFGWWEWWNVWKVVVYVCVDVPQILPLGGGELERKIDSREKKGGIRENHGGLSVYGLQLSACGLSRVIIFVVDANRNDDRLGGR